MNFKSLVSVIIPTYNRANVIEDSINSVLDQTYKDIEIIVVDDNSNDNTIKVLEKYKDKIKVIKHERNLGGGAARNTGIRNSNGTYIAFLDSDDVWEKNKLENQIEIMKKNPDISVCFCNYIMVNKVNEEIVGRHNINTKGDVTTKLFFNNYIGTTSALIVKKSSLIEVNGFDETLRSCQDWDLYFKLASKNKFYFCSEFLLKQYYHSERISTNYDNKIQGYIKMIKKIEEYLTLNNNYKKEVILSNLYLNLGKNYINAENKKEGKKYIFKSLKYNYFNIKSYIYLLMLIFS